MRKRYFVTGEPVKINGRWYAVGAQLPDDRDYSTLQVAGLARSEVIPEVYRATSKKKESHILSVVSETMKGLEDAKKPKNNSKGQGLFKDKGKRKKN